MHVLIKDCLETVRQMSESYIAYLYYFEKFRGGKSLLSLFSFVIEVILESLLTLPKTQPLSYCLYIFKFL